MGKTSTPKNNQKYIFVTGGVVSSVGKGLVSASLATLLEQRGYKVSLIKCDPYINVDPGTLSPFQHGEVYVTQDGGETDLDLGHYERFTNSILTKDHSITTGQVYQTVIENERRGNYLGKTVQVIPHITNEIKRRIVKASAGADVTVIEIGGTVGDIEGLPFIEAIRQMRIELGPQQTAFAHVTFVPYIKSAGEMKSKPTQHSVKALREVGLQPDFLLCRSSQKISKDLKSKIALFSNLHIDDVIAVQDAETIYEIPLLLNKEKLDDKLSKKLNLKKSEANLNQWKSVVQKIKNPKQEVTIGLVGKYVHIKDSYQSIHEALVHGGLSNQTKVNVEYINSENLDGMSQFKNLDGILVPGGFGDRGIDGKIKAIQFSRENGVPFFGICLGMQMAAIEFARNVCGVKNATSREFLHEKNAANNFVIDMMPSQKGVHYKGGSMRVGTYTCVLEPHSKISKIYKSNTVDERHRHRYEFNPDYSDMFESKGMKIVGRCKEGSELVEALELTDHPWFFGVQYHPEFQSKPTQTHPLFKSFIKSCL